MDPNNPNSNNPNDPNVTPNPFGQPVDPSGPVQPTQYQNNIGPTAPSWPPINPDPIGVNPIPVEPLNPPVSTTTNPFLTDNPVASTNPFLSSTPVNSLPGQPALSQNNTEPVAQGPAPVSVPSPYGVGLAAQDYSAQLPPTPPNFAPDLASTQSVPVPNESAPMQPEPVPTFLPDNTSQTPMQSGPSSISEPTFPASGPALTQPDHAEGGQNEALMNALNMPQTGVSVTPLDSVPTDLSHLVESQPSIGVPPAPASAPSAQPDTIFVPPTQPEVPTNVVAGSKSGIPVWIFGAGALVLVAVIAASAYFILGVGKPVEETTSVPIQQPLTNPPKAVKPSIPPILSVTPGGGSSTFGALQGASPAGQRIPPSSSSPSATTVPSALELLRQRQTAPVSP